MTKVFEKRIKMKYLEQPEQDPVHNIAATFSACGQRTVASTSQECLEIWKGTGLPEEGNLYLKK